MGRKEKPLDPAAGAVQRFAFELRKLRDEAGAPTYRAMARRAGYSGPTLSAAAAGERLPTLPVLTAYVIACDGEVADWTARWRAAVAEATEPAPPDGTDSPYPGLARFETGDGDHFHGRADLVAELLALTARRRVAAVVGASGSGKSSLLRAGLVPALRHPGDGAPRPAAIRVLTPGAHPARTHTDRFVPHPGPGDTLLVVDQFEETFALCADPAERERFVALLLSAQDPAHRLRVLIAVRADFYGRCADHGPLAAALRDSTLLVGPMAAPQLREAVVRPAAARRLIVERALTARIVTDVAGEPGGLPLMAHALREVWRRRTGKTLTLAAYEAIGGVHGAVAHTAETLYAALAPAERTAVRRLLLRLVTPGDGTADTRRPADRAELGTDRTTAAVLERLVRARLLTVDGDTVDLAHEALLGAWPRLRGWLDEDRERLRAHRRLTQAARTWHDLARDEGALYRGIRLAEARELFETTPGTAAGGSREREHFPGEPTGSPPPTPATPPPELTDPEAAFLAASAAADLRVRRAAVRAARRTRGLLVGLAVLLCLVGVAGLTAWRQSEVSERRQDEAEARRVAALAETLGSAEPRTAMRLALAAWHTADLPETRQALRSAAAQSDQDAFSRPVDGSPFDNAPSWLSSDGRILTYVAPDDRVVQWDVPGQRQLLERSLPGITEGVLGVGADGRLVAHGSADGRELLITDLAEGVTRSFTTRTGPDTDVEFGADGRFVVLRRLIPGTDGRAELEVWDVVDRRLVVRHGEGADDGPSPALGPGARYLSWCTESGGRLRVLDTRTGRLLAQDIPRATELLLCEAEQRVFTPDGHALAAATGEGVVTWDFTEGRERPRLPVDGGVLEVEFSGPYALTWRTGTLALWRTDTPAPADGSPHEPVLTHPFTGTAVGDLRLDPVDGVLRFRTGGYAEVVRTVSLQGVTGPDWHPAAAVAEDPGDTDPAVAADLRDRRELTAEGDLVDLATSTSRRVVSGEDLLVAGAFAPDGRQLAVSDNQGRVTLWDIPAGRRLAVLRAADVTTAHSTVLAFSADGSLLAASSADGSVRVWETASPGLPPAVLPVGDGPVRALRFDSDGRLRVDTPHLTDRARELTPGRVADRLCTLADGGPDESEWRENLPSVPYRDVCADD
ncbi:hypothetical protein ACFRI7_19980 [Streptomyces sp. NPDC056716]|uniref:nSTAND1 domain-containing NTPase n=1 Tax=Streptomyces sp. NPDC056716 TaxID=3345922 RepID=UPI003679EEB7